VATAGTLVATVIGRQSATESSATTLTTVVPHVLRHHLRPHPVPNQAFADGPTQISRSSAPRGDALDTISLADELPDLDLGDFVYSENIGAYSHASSTHFNGFPPAKVVHVNRE